MKRILAIILVAVSFSFVFAAKPEKKQKLIDHYYLDFSGNQCHSSMAAYEIRVMSEADSVKVYTYSLIQAFENTVGNIYRIETYKTLTDSIQVKWGTQQEYYENGKLHRHHFVDLARGKETCVTFNRNQMTEQEIETDLNLGVTQVVNYYPSGAKKSVNKTERDFRGREITEYAVWGEDGKLVRTQKLENSRTTYLTLYDEDGRICLRMPFQQGDTIYFNKDGNATTRRKSDHYALVNLDVDSIKFNLYNINGQPTGIQNFKEYTPEAVTVWGVQKSFYTTTAQPVDSLVQFCSIHGETLVEHKYYPDGKLMSTMRTTFDPVLVPIKELRQYYPTGVLRRVQTKHGDADAVGHIYDSQGNETLPFYEFKE